MDKIPQQNLTFRPTVTIILNEKIHISNGHFYEP
jgi:hypothetical protein